MSRELSVTEISRYITAVFDAEELLHSIKVYGEVSNLHYVRGNAYFNLKDESSLLSCIMFGVTSMTFKEGDQVLATGSIRYYSSGGRVNFYVNAISPYGAGALYARFIELKNRLEAEGVFDKKYKKSLPSNIKKIGVITSKTGAVIHDIETVSHRRNPLLDIDVYPSKVQGDDADIEIISGLEYFGKRDDIDVIIIARGGGSIEDLQPFNSERLARKIIEIDKPVISAVGHETDFTICDFASSIRCATPSEAAEIVAKDTGEALSVMNNLLNKSYILLCNKIDEQYSYLDKNIIKMNSMLNRKVERESNNFRLIVFKLLKIDFIEPMYQKINMLEDSLRLLNPRHILERGFARVTKGGEVLLDSSKVQDKDRIDIELLNGRIVAEVKK